MNEVLLKDDIKIEDMIYEIRGKYVMLDSDLGRIYECKNGTKTINQAVSRHIDRFPSDFYFQLSQNEYEYLQSQVGTANLNTMTRVLPCVFTEQGVAMLATVLRTKVAAEMSVSIMRAFVKMRRYINYNKSSLPYKFLLLEDKVDNNTKRIDELFAKFDPKVIAKNYLFFSGELYDAYSLLMDILNEANEEVIIIDNYAGKELLDILKNIDKKIIIVSKNIDDKLKVKYKSQYTNIIFINNDSFHDRFIIIDRCKLYSCGASFKDLGKKCFAINEVTIKEYLDEILKIILKTHQ